MGEKYYVFKEGVALWKQEEFSRFSKNRNVCCLVTLRRILDFEWWILDGGWWIGADGECWILDF